MPRYEAKLGSMASHPVLDGMREGSTPQPLSVVCPVSVGNVVAGVSLIRPIVKEHM